MADVRTDADEGGVWDAEGWVEAFPGAIARTNGETTHSMQRKVLESTLRVLDAGGYRSEKGEGAWVVVPEPSEHVGTIEGVAGGTVMYDFGGGGTSGAVAMGDEEWMAFVEALPADRWLHADHSGVRVDVVDGDILVAAAALVAEGSDGGEGECGGDGGGERAKVLVLNMASASHPGGGYRSGQSAQEENLCRRTDYSVHLDAAAEVWEARAWRYPLPAHGAVYSKAVTVFRGPQTDGYPLLDAPFSVAVVGVAAKRRPAVVKTRGGAVRMTDAAKIEARHRIRSIFKVAVLHGHTRLALSALGAGAYRNPPADVARIMHQVLFSEFGALLEHVVFAVMDDHNCGKPHNPDGNVKPFRDVFAP